MAKQLKDNMYFIHKNKEDFEDNPKKYKYIDSKAKENKYKIHNIKKQKFYNKL